MSEKEVSNKAIFELVSSLYEKVNNDVTMKSDLERVKEEILDVVRPIERAVDKDAVKLVSHESRITKLERHPVLGS